MRTLVINQEEQGALVQVLAAKLKISKKKAKRMLDARCVFVNGRRIWMAQSPVRPGDRIEIQDEPPRVSLSRGSILYEDEQFLVYNKPPGILSDGEDSLEVKLRELLEIKSLCAVHRLDRDTSGCVIFAKSRAFKEQAAQLFRHKKVFKYYQALVYGTVPIEIEEITRPIDGIPAVTRLQILGVNKEATLVKVQIITGRMHQIRKHMANIGHPLVGDKEYATQVVAATYLRSTARQMLHACSLDFENPVSGKAIHAEAPLPEDFVKCLHLVQLG